MNIELGAFEKREGWITIDRDLRSDICQDVRHLLPFPCDCVDRIYSSHLLEHLTHNEMIRLLWECRRVLKTGGIFEAAVPNGRIYIEAYLKPELFVISDTDLYAPAFHYYSKIDFINYFAYLDGLHHFMFDEENLPKIITYAGFKDVRLRSFKEGLDMKARAHESIYVEGVKL